MTGEGSSVSRECGGAGAGIKRETEGSGRNAGPLFRRSVRSDPAGRGRILSFFGILPIPEKAS